MFLNMEKVKHDALRVGLLDLALGEIIMVTIPLPILIVQTVVEIPLIAQVLIRPMFEPRFIPVQVNLTPKQIEYLETVRQLDGIARGPYIGSFLKRNMERGFILFFRPGITVLVTITPLS